MVAPYSSVNISSIFGMICHSQMTARLTWCMSKHNLILPDACLGTTTIVLGHDVGPCTFYVMSSEGSWLTSSETFYLVCCKILLFGC